MFTLQIDMQATGYDARMHLSFKLKGTARVQMFEKDK